ncbi:unannotated protein [freshwater metagenome]|uniref:Unannotated protein n=1 Tax=freshwater metagenome TaxID=449393 RepID=A0A6J7IZS0_9ZZZZ
MPSDRKLIFEVALPPYWAPGSMTSRAPTIGSAELDTIACALPRSSEKFRPNLASTSTVMNAAPAMSRTALMICTHVVPFIPPMSTYAIISTPTMAITMDCPVRSEMSSSSATSPPAPAI